MVNLLLWMQILFLRYFLETLRGETNFAFERNKFVTVSEGYGGERMDLLLNSGMIFLIIVCYFGMLFFIVNQLKQHKLFAVKFNGLTKFSYVLILASFVYFFSAPILELMKLFQAKDYCKMTDLINSVVCGIVGAGVFAMVDYDDKSGNDKSDDSSHGCCRCQCRCRCRCKCKCKCKCEDRCGEEKGLCVVKDM